MTVAVETVSGDRGELATTAPRESLKIVDDDEDGTIDGDDDEAD